MNSDANTKFKYITRNFPWLIPVLLLFIISIPSLPAISLPNRDSAVFQYAGSRMLSGQIPYVDFWDHKGPFIFIVNAIGAFISANQPFGVWLVEFILLAAALIIGERLGKNILSPKYGVAAACLCVVGLAITYKGNLPEEYGILLQFIIMYLFWIDLNKPRFIYLVLIGLLTGVSFLFRPNNIGMTVAVGMTVIAKPILLRERPDFRKIISNLSGLFIGIVVFGGATVLVMYVNHTLTDYIQASILFNVAYADNGVLNRFKTALFGILVLNLLFVYGYFGIRYALQRYSDITPIQKQFFFFVCAGLLIEIALQSLSGRLYLHYYSPWLPYLCLLGALGLMSFERIKIPLGIRNITNIVMALMAAQFLFNSVYQYARVLSPTARAEFFAAHTVVDEIQTNTSLQDTILVWGSESYIYTLSDRIAPTRFFYQYPLIANTAMDSIWTQQFFQEIQNKRPRFIIYSDTNSEFPPMDKAGTIKWGQVNQRKINSIFLNVLDYLQFNYQETKVIGTWHIYQLK